MAPFYCQFDILWIVIAAPNDDHVFEATGNKQHVFLEETHVSSAQERTFPCICQVCPERILSLLRFVPVALSNAGASYPDFPYFVRHTLGEGLRMNNDDPLIGRLQLTPYNLPCILIPGRGHSHSIMLDCPTLKRANDYWVEPCAGSRDQSRLGKPIGGEKCLSVKSIWPKGLYKLVQRLITDRLSSISSHLP